MANISSVQLLNNPAPFTDPISVAVTYDCFKDLEDDLEWKIIYVGSAESEAADQVLDSALVGPVKPGKFQFQMDAPAPDPARIPPADLLGCTALLLTCSYKGTEFVRVGYYVNVEYTDPALMEAPPSPPQLDKLVRSILADQPRVTKFPCDFDDASEARAAIIGVADAGASVPAGAIGIISGAEGEGDASDGALVEADEEDLLEDDDDEEEEDDDDEEDSEEGMEEEVDLENEEPNVRGARASGAPEGMDVDTSPRKAGPGLGMAAQQLHHQQQQQQQQQQQAAPPGPGHVSGIM